MPAPPELVKFPRTPHLLGSQLQPGDEDLPRIDLSSFGDCTLFVSEKLDGTNVGLRFDAEGKPWLQSRGHYLGSESHFDLLKQWAHQHAAALHERLGSAHLVYGEWLYARHTVFYDRLPSYLIAFDVLALETQRFLTTPERERLLAGLPIVSAPVLWSGPTSAAQDALNVLGASRFKSSEWRDRLRRLAEARGLDVERTLEQAEPSTQMEGLYFRAEDSREVRARFKFVRPGFRQTVDDSGSHWASRPLIPNQLAAR